MANPKRKGRYSDPEQRSSKTEKTEKKFERKEDKRDFGKKEGHYTAKEKYGKYQGKSFGERTKMHAKKALGSSLAMLTPKTLGYVGKIAKDVETMNIPKVFEDGADMLTYVERSGDDFAMNHPEWYANDPIGPMAINLNYYRRLDQALVSIADIVGTNNGTAAAVPTFVRNYVGMTTYASGDDSAMWDTAIQRIRNTLTMRNGRNTVYYATTISSYIHNIRVLYGLLADFMKIWQTTNYFSTTNPSAREQLREALAVDVESFVDSAADCKEWLTRTLNQITTTYPSMFDLNKRTYWLFSNFFADYVGPKPTLYCNLPAMPVFLDASGNVITTISNKFTELGHYAGGNDNNTTAQDMMRIITNAITQLNGLYAGTQLQADFARVYGIDEHFIKLYDEIVKTQVPEITIICDEHYLHQIQNANPGQCILFANATDSPIQPSIQYRVQGSSITYKYIYTGNNNQSAFDIMIKALNKAYINATPKTQTDQNYLTSSTRLITLYKAGEDTNEEMIVASCGTEQLLSTTVIVPEWKETGDTVCISKHTRPSVMIINAVGNNALPIISRFISLAESDSVDYLPSVKVFANIFSEGWKTVIDWDFDTFAEVPYETMRSLHARATNSLLYPTYRDDSANGFMYPLAD